MNRTPQDEVDEYTQQLLLAPELMTWGHDPIDGSAVFLVPEGVDISTFPAEIAGIPIKLDVRPRPDSAYEEAYGGPYPPPDDEQA